MLCGICFKIVVGGCSVSENRIAVTDGGGFYMRWDYSR